MGRCKRKRNRRIINKKCPGVHVLVANEFDMIKNLMKWMITNGFDKRSCHVAVTNFEDTGRGLMSCKRFTKEETVLSIPYQLLITTSTVLSSYLAPILQKYTGELLSPVELLSWFLICEKSRGQQSSWSSYIDVLPVSYTIPLFWSESELRQLPLQIYYEAMKSINQVKLSFSKLQELYRLTEDFDSMFIGAFTYSAYCWAWASVNTRCVFMDQSPSTRSAVLNKEPNHYALAPLLDLFNHRTDAQIQAGFDNKTQSYRLKTLSNCPKFRQIFINYGPHDNTKLLLEYGFVQQGNPHDSIKFTLDDVISAYFLCCNKKTKEFDFKIDFIRKKKLDRFLQCTDEGLSWNLSTALSILSSPYSHISSSDVFCQQELPPNVKFEMDTVASNLIKAALRTIPNDNLQDDRSSTGNGNMKLAHQFCSIYKNILSKCLIMHSPDKKL